MGRALERLAPAKVNLALHVLGRREDGYHELDTLAVFASVGDLVAVVPADALSLSLDGPFAGHAPAHDGNLVLRAARMLQAEAGVERGAAIRLTKRLPAGAGIGGGSANAAAALLLLNEAWGARCDAASLARLGLSLGADVPMCLAGQALRARGVGERIALLDGLPPLPLVLVWPGRPVSTPASFAALRARENPPLPDMARPRTLDDLVGYLSDCRNDLEAASAAIEPAIGAASAALLACEGCRLARMSGSGSAFFGIFEGIEAASAAAESLRAARPDWWVAAALAR